MKLFDKIRGRATQNRARDKPALLVSEEPDYAKMQTPMATRADMTMKGSEAIYAAVSRISNTIATMPVHLYRGDELQAGDYRERLLNYRPNPYMTGFTFRQTMEANRNNEGTAYALMVPNLSDTEVVRLDVLDPARVLPVRDKDTGEMWYQLIFEDGTRPMVHSGRMLVLRHMSANGVRGIRPVDVLRGTLMYDANIKEFSSKQLEGVNSGVVLNVPGTGLSEPRKKEIIRQFLNAYRDSGGRLVVLEGGVTATTLTQTPVDANVLDVERITRNRVATVYNIPPHMLGDYSDASYNTAEQSTLEFMQMTINPIITQWEEELNQKLLTWDMLQKGYSFRFDMRRLWRTDAKTMAEVRQINLRGGCLKVNEARKEDGLPPDPSGDVLMVSRDLVPLSTATSGQAQP